MFSLFLRLSVHLFLSFFLFLFMFIWYLGIYAFIFVFLPSSSRSHSLYLLAFLFVCLAPSPLLSIYFSIFYLSFIIIYLSICPCFNLCLCAWWNGDRQMDSNLYIRTRTVYVYVCVIPCMCVQANPCLYRSVCVCDFTFVMDACESLAWLCLRVRDQERDKDRIYASPVWLHKCMSVYITASCFCFLLLHSDFSCFFSPRSLCGVMYTEEKRYSEYSSEKGTTLSNIVWWMHYIPMLLSVVRERLHGHICCVSGMVHVARWILLCCRMNIEGSLLAGLRLQWPHFLPRSKVFDIIVNFNGTATYCSLYSNSISCVG